MSELAAYRVLAGACAAAGVLGVGGWFARGAGWARALWAITGVVVALGAVVVWAWRVSVAGHLPIFGTYESALSLALAVLLVALAWDLRLRFRAAAFPFAALVAAAVLAQGLRHDPTVFGLTISERSIWVDVHAIAAWLAFGVLAVNAAFAARTLLARADDASWDRRVARSLELGFVLHSAMMATGSFYKFLLFGTAWSFDPVETLGFAAWISYGTLLHMQLLSGWRGRRLAAWCLFVFAVLIVSYRLIVYFPAWSTYHIFDVDLRMHIPG